MNKQLIKVFYISAIGVGFLSLANAGSLEPPGPPAPTFKNLGDVEPRQIIRANTEVIEAIVISQPGSYYLGEDITAIPDNNAITITADDVSLDLNGFTVRGNLEVTDGHGINVSGDHVTIRNGNVKFADGDGIHCQSAAYLTLIDVNSVSNGGFGVLCSQMHILNGAFSKNGKSGVNGSSVQAEGVNASENTSHGFFLGNPAMVSRSIVLGNGGDGVRCAGLSGVVMQTVATFNTGANWVNCTVIDSYAP